MTVKKEEVTNVAETNKEEVQLDAPKETSKKEKKITTKSDNKVNSKNGKWSKHWDYFENVDVVCICWSTFQVSTTIAGPIKVETCHMCHPTYNPDRVVQKVVKWRLEKYLEKQKRVDAVQKK